MQHAILLSVCVGAISVPAAAAPGKGAPGMEAHQKSMGHAPSTEPEDSPFSLLPVDPRTPLRGGTPREKSSMEASLTADSTDILPDWISQLGTPRTETTIAGIEQAMATAATKTGVYTVGYASRDFAGNTSKGAYDFVVTKHLPSGVRSWARQFGTSTNDYATGVATSTLNSPHLIYVTGYTSASFDGKPYAGGVDAVLLKLDENGNQLLTAQLGSSGHDYAQAVATDNTGNVYITGYTTGSLNGANAGGQDIFVAKYDSAGVRKWVHQLGTSNNEQARGIATDKDGFVYIVGHTFGPLGGNTKTDASADLFLVKYDPVTGQPLKTVRHGTSAVDMATGIATSRRLDGTVDIYVAGYTLGDFDGVGGDVSKGQYDALVVKFDQQGTRLWSKQLGTPGNEFVYGVASDGGANIYLTGSTNSDLKTETSVGSNDIFMMKLNASGSLLALRQIGSVNEADPLAQADIAFGIAADIDRNVYVVGHTQAAFAQPKTESQGDRDFVVMKYNDGCQATFSTRSCGIGYGWGDPHLVTFDRQSYDFQGAGEFILVENSDDKPFVVQARMQPWKKSATSEPSKLVSVMTAVATRIGTDRVGFYLNQSPPVRVNGTPVSLAVDQVLPLPSGGRIHRQSSTSYVVSFLGDELMIVTMPTSYMNINFALPTSRKGNVRGLLGNYNASGKDDFALRDGAPLAPPLTFAQLYTSTTSMATSWRITPTESLFDYGPGESTATFNVPNFPSAATSTTSLTTTQKQDAELVCRNQGVTNPVTLEGCILDVALTGEPALAQGATAIAQQDQSLGGGTSAPPPAETAKLVYFNNFENGAPEGGEWSSAVTSSTPMGDRTFLGEFTAQSVNLHLDNLPAHTHVTVSFDLLVLQGWDGDGSLGPHVWGLNAQGVGRLMEATLSNTTSTQSYPTSGRPARTGAAAINQMLYPDGDSLYRMKFTLHHTASALDLEFFARGLQGLTGEAWGLDNVEVVVETRKLGTTWIRGGSDSCGQTRVTCDNCNPYVGDTLCTEARQLLCIKVDGSAACGSNPINPSYEWTGGTFALTPMVYGTQLTSLNAANNICASIFGAGYRMAEHHDGGGWSAWGKGLIAPLTTPSSTYPRSDIPNSPNRFWVHIDNQPGNCWD